jgi:hypothetical protein
MFFCKLMFYACYLFFFYTRNLWGEEILGNFLGGGSIKFFNRSPLTLKFGAEKERESQERDSERARERERERERASCCFYVRKLLLLLYTRKLMFFSCYSKLVSWHSILVIYCSTLVYCYSTLVICCSVL